MAETWRAIAAEVQHHRDSSLSQIQPLVADVPTELPSNVTAIPRQLLTAEEVEITETSPERLLAHLSAGTLSSVKVINAFLRRARLAQKLVNCITEAMPDQALARAKYLDDYLAEHKKPIGPLHGLPISLKEHHSVEGLTINCGYVAWHNKVAKMNSHTVGLLLHAGAILYVRTTEPQTLMHAETSSNLYGVTVNPYNRELTCGGSSGGEGALIGLRGSCLGLGTDIGGSIRGPAAMNGLWGFRPSGHRLPMYGVEAAMHGYDSITPVVGPMSTSFEGLHLLMKTIIDQKPWKDDPSLVPIAWNYPPNPTYLTKNDGQRRLRVAFLWHDGVVRPHPPIVRALRELAEKLRSDPNVQVCDWKPYNHSHANDLALALYLPDGGADIRGVLESSGEPWRPLTNYILREIPSVKELSIAELWSQNMQREVYRAQYAGLWNSTAADDKHGDPVDVIISPAAPGVATPLDQAKYFGYCSQWNVLDYPAMVFPYGTVDQKLDELTDEDIAYEPRDPLDAHMWSLWRDRGGAKGCVDAPIGLQVIGRRFEDEKVFEAMQWIKQVAAL